MDCFQNAETKVNFHGPKTHFTVIMIKGILQENFKDLFFFFEHEYKKINGKH